MESGEASVSHCQVLTLGLSAAEGGISLPSPVAMEFVGQNYIVLCGVATVS